VTGVRVNTLLEACAGDAACGDNLEYDADVTALERAAAHEPEQVMGDATIPAKEPEWADVEHRAEDLFTRTKDLRIAALWARARLGNDGFFGFAEGCALVRGLLETYWDDIYPQLDPDDDNDPTYRINALAAFNDEDGFLAALRAAPLVSSRVFGAICYRDLAILSGDLEPVDSDSGDELNASTIDAAFAESDTESLAEIAAAIESARNDVAAIEGAFSERLGVEQSPEFDRLNHLLKAIAYKFGQRLAERGIEGGTESVGAEALPDRAGDGGAATAPAQATPGQIRNRDDVVRMIDKICDYYQKNEPSSPVPVLLKRARRLVSKNFLEIMRDLTPDGLSQAELFQGPGDDEQSYD
jgi:type VI secretion system protein ImpA